METRTGHCLCGATAYAFPDEAIDWEALCTCASCRRATGAPVAGWIGVWRDRFAWTGAAPGRYPSSPGVERTFCRTCGTPLTFSTAKRPDQIDVLAATLADPARFTPARWDFAAEHLGWPGLDIRLPPGD